MRFFKKKHIFNEHKKALLFKDSEDSGLNNVRNLTQNFCLRLDDIKRRIVILRND